MSLWATFENASAENLPLIIGKVRLDTLQDIQKLILSFLCVVQIHFVENFTLGKVCALNDTLHLKQTPD